MDINDDFGENIFFSLDEANNVDNADNEYNADNVDFVFNKIDDYLSKEEISEIMCFEYKTNYNVKELLIICEYYGMSKELKMNKCNKDEIVFFLVDFENDQLNSNIVTKRRELWRCITMLKNDKFMKKYVLW
jgi:hypothetical protein